MQAMTGAATGTTTILAIRTTEAGAGGPDLQLAGWTASFLRVVA